MSRYAHQRRVLGDEQFVRLQAAKVLVVGAGGIGCELLKNLVMTGFVDIELIDLDTIDLSNLNRQFLFQKQHISKSKAHVARETALRFNPDAKIKSHHASIKDSCYDADFFRGFTIVMNALDNLDARRHVNRMCLQADVPIIESGTAGYLGQVTVIKRTYHPLLLVIVEFAIPIALENHQDITECFECQPKPTPKTFPVCTIRSTPTAPIHCIVWAKSYLFSQLFGKAEEEEAAPADPNSENAAELESLRKEAAALLELKQSMFDPNYPARVFEKVFSRDIVRLASMAEMWKKRDPPKALNFQEIAQTIAETKETSDGTASGLKDQRVWSLKENLDAFVSSTETLVRRIQAGEESINFDKDDADALTFVTAASNLRAHIFGIDLQSRFKVKAMAGNIIPAIATTNAIVAGMMVIQSLRVLQGDYDKCSTSYLVYGGRRDRLILSEKLATPNKSCYVCQNSMVTIRVNPEVSTLKSFLTFVVKPQLSMAEPTVVEGDRMLYDLEFDDNVEKSLAEIGVVHGKTIRVTDEVQSFSVVLEICKDESLPQDGPEQFVLSGHIPEAQPVVADVDAPSKKRKATDRDDVDEGASTTDAKRARKDEVVSSSSATNVDDMDIVELDSDPSAHVSADSTDNIVDLD